MGEYFFPFLFPSFSHGGSPQSGSRNSSLHLLLGSSHERRAFPTALLLHGTGFPPLFCWTKLVHLNLEVYRREKLLWTKLIEDIIWRMTRTVSRAWILCSWNIRHLTVDSLVNSVMDTGKNDFIAWWFFKFIRSSLLLFVSGVDKRSFEVFVDAVVAIQKGDATPATFAHSLASIASTYRTTAILEAGRRSLDSKKTIQIQYDNKDSPCQPTGLIEL